ncbi:S-adenosyl-L-methionine-dependent methyltransferase [Chytridium lagenaria]|nr:S-adenosyl-L-methionine-dependent methyltransferase [Chytridium lagenaria]
MQPSQPQPLRLTGVPVGAFIVSPQHAHTLSTHLRTLHWLKTTGTKVTPYDDETGRVAVHLNTRGAGEMERGEGIHRDEVVRLAGEIGAVWMQGLRVGSKEIRAHNTGRKSTFRFIELFAGIGGFRFGLEPLGGTCVFASEISAECRRVYSRYHFSEERKKRRREWSNYSGAAGLREPEEEDEEEMLVGDITEVDACNIPDFDLLTAGFPCQTFCKVGPKTGLRDVRGELFFEIVRILHVKQPRAFILENVANLVDFENGEVFELILGHLEGVGYECHWKVIDAAAYLPQVRKRVYIVGFRHGTLRSDRIPFEWPEASIDSSIILRSILDPDPPSPDLLLAERHMNVVATTWGYRPLTTEKGELSNEQKGEDGLVEEILHQTKSVKGGWDWRTAKVDGKARTLMSSYKVGFRLYSEFVPVPIPEPFASGDIGEGKDGRTSRPLGSLRFYSPRECAKIMGFPEDMVEVFPKPGEKRKEGKKDKSGDLEAMEANIEGNAPGIELRNAAKRISGRVDPSSEHSGPPLPQVNAFYHMIGNAVCPPVIRAIAEGIIKVL